MKSRIAMMALVFAWAMAADFSQAVLAWDEDGHVIVTRLASSQLPDSMPDWIKTPEVLYRLDYLSAEPDRWRGQQHPMLNHINNPDHYFDIDLLPLYGLTMDTLPQFRREFVDRLAACRAAEPEKFADLRGERDRDYTNLSPGLLPWRIAELQWRIASGWTTLRTYEKHRDRVTDRMIENARENIIRDMGILSHYIGDGCQPLHTTKHHHGWEGSNPKGYTIEGGFHQMIDGGVLAHHDVNYVELLPRAKKPRRVDPETYWKEIKQYLSETHALVEPLYELEKSGTLMKPEGKRFIEDRLIEGGSMLAGVWIAAYEGSHLDEFRENRLKERDPDKVGQPRRSAPVSANEDKKDKAAAAASP